MRLDAYNFGKPQDIRMAIDLLNSLIADCMVSEKWLTMHVTVPSYLKDAATLDGKPARTHEEILKDQATDILFIREKLVTYWLSLHHALHKAIDERQPSEATEKYFNLMWHMFNHNRIKLLDFIENASPVGAGECTSLRKQWYNQKHYFTLRDIDPDSDLGKPLIGLLPEHEYEDIE